MKMDRKTKRVPGEKSITKHSEPNHEKPTDIQFASVVEQINEGFVALDAQMNYIYINKRGSEILKREPENLIGKNYWDEYPEDKITAFGQAYLRALETQTPIELEDYYAPGDRWFENRIYPTEGGLSIFFNDVTKRKEAEKAVRRTQEEWSDFVENASVGMHWVGPDGIIMWANRFELEMLGYTTEEYIGHHIAEFHADASVIEDILRRLTLGETLNEYPARMLCKDGSIRDVLINSNVLWENGKFVHTRCFTRDITARKRAEETIRESEERFQTLANGSPVLLWVNGLEGCEFVNREYLDFLGLAAQTDVHGYDWSGFVHPDDREAYTNAYLRAFEKRAVFSTEFRFRRHDGEYRWMRSEATPRRAADGSFLGYVGASIDITVRKRAELALQTSEHQLRLITDAMPALISYIDNEYHYRFVNRTYREWFGYEGEEVIGKTAMEVLGAAAFERLQPHMEAALAGKTEIFETETPYQRGGTRFIRAIYTPDIAADGRVNGFFVLVLDITKRKQAEEALAEYARQQGALYQFTDRLQHTKTLEDIFNASLDAILSALQCDRASILLFDKADVMRFVAWRGLSDDYRKITDGHSPWTRDEKNPEPICMDDIHTAELSDSLRTTIKAEGIGSLAFIPLVFNGKLIGKFMTYFNEPHAFTEMETELSLTIAHQLAFGIERKRDEDALRRSEERLRLATQAARMFTWELDIRTQVSTVANNFAEALGFSPDLIPKDNEEILEEFIHPDDTQVILKALTEAVQSHRDLFSLQYRIINPENGQPIWLDVNGRVIYDQNGHPERMFGVAQNVTENKQTEEHIRYLNRELQAHLDEMNTLLDILPTGVWIGNHDCSEITGNPAAYAMLGFEPGMNVSVTNSKPQISTGMRIFVNGKEVDPDDAPMQMAARSGKPLHGFEHELLFPDGSRKAFHTSAIPLFDQNGSVRKVIASYTDFTERKRAENRLALLAEVSELTRQIEDPAELTYAIATAVGEHLQVRRCLFNETDLERDTETVHRDYHNGVESVAGIHKVSDYSNMTSAEMAAGKTVINNDSKTDPRTAQDYEKTYALSGERAYVAVPLMRENRWVGTLWASDDKPRQWSPEEVSLLETVAERAWTVVEKLRINQALRESENTLQIIINTVPALISYVDREHRYRFVNQTYNEWFGHAPNEIEGQPVYNVLGDSAYEAIRPYVEKVLSGEAISFDRLIPYKDGGSRFVLGQYVPDKDINGRVKGYFSLVQDITERKRAEEALRESEARYRFIVENTSDGIWQIELTEPMPISLPEEEQLDWYYKYALIRQCNLELAQMYGYNSVEEVVGLQMQVVMPRDNPVNLELARQFIRSGYRLVDAESREMTSEGRELIFLNNMVGVIEAGKLTGEWGTNRDITERKRAEEERDQLLLQEQAQRASAEQARLEAEQARAEAERELAERRMAEAALGEWADAPLSHETRPAWMRYGMALAITTLTILLRVVLQPFLGDSMPLVTLYGAVAFSVWFGGIGPALLSMLLGYFGANWFVMEPLYVLTLDAENITGLGLFLFSSTVIIALGQGMRRAQRHAHQSARVAVKRQHQVETQLQEKQRTEEALRRSEQLFSTLVDASPFGVYFIDSEFRLRAINKGSESVFSGIEPLIGRDFAEILHLIWKEPFASEAIERFRHTLLTGESFISPPVVEQRANIEEIEAYDWQIHRITLSDGSYGVVCYFYDLSEQKKMEATVRASEQLYRTIARSIPGGGVYVLDKNFRYLVVEGPVTEAFGLSRERLEGRTVMEVFPDERGERMEERLRRNFAGESVEFETQFNGHFYWTQMAPLHESIGQTIILTVDITDRKLAEEALRESERKFSLIFHKLPFAAALSNPVDGTLADINEAFERVFGYPRQEALSKTALELGINPDSESRENLLATLREHNSVRDQEVELFTKPLGARIFLLNLDMVGIGGEQYILQTAQDITERKQAEEALRRSEERFARFMQYLPGLAWIKDSDGRYIYANAAAEKAFKTTRENLYGRTDEEVFDPETASQFKRNDELALMDEKGVQVTETLEQEDGLHYSLVNKFPIPGPDGSTTLIGGTAFDITERKRAEEALRESEERFRAILRQATAGIVRKDAEGKFIFFNDAFCTMLGYSEAELSGKTVWEFTHPDDLEENKRLYDRAMSEGVSFKLEKRLIRKDGSIVWVDVSVSPITDTTGKPQSAVAIEVDITRRKEAEEALQQLNLQLESRVQRRTVELQTVNQSLRNEIAERLKVEDALHESRRRLQILTQRLVDVQEEERRAIARELHDRVGQSLSALNINLVILDNQISDHVDQPIRTRLDDSMQLVAETINLVRDVMSDLRPPVLDDYGLEATLQSHLSAFKSRYGIDVQFEKPDQPLPRLGTSIEMTFVRIAQEALMNVARHAKASQVTLSLQQDGKAVRLIVQDDGEGIKSWQEANRPGSHGLTIMRERAEAFGGDLQVSSIPGKGVKVDASIPIDSEEPENEKKERPE